MSDEQRMTLADILRGAADRIDAEDVPQTAEDVADFVDGARWATAQLRQIAVEADAEPAGDATPDWLVELVRRYAPSTSDDRIEQCAQAIRDSNGTPEALEWWRTHPQLIPAHVYAVAALAVADATAPVRLNSAERATLRFALELAEEQMLSRSNEFAAVDFAALESLKQRAGGGVPGDD